ncbi:acyl-CoA thiolase [Spongiibacter sp.]|uniref:thiolase family protein n=1 Tax=Spongiibacter sp. TaxID=2024860 RepID=UPI003567CD75
MDAYLYDCLRSPRAKAVPEQGTLAALAPQMMVAQLVAGLEQRHPGLRDSAQQLLLGCVGQVASQGGNIALVSKVAAGLPDSAAAYSLNNYCVSGLTAISQAALAVQAGLSQMSLAGGVENMSQVPFMADRASYYQDTSLPRAGRFLPVPVAADLLASHSGVARAQLDAISLRSQQRAAAAQQVAALNASMVAMCDGDGAVLLDRDEAVRAGVTAEALAAMPAAFAEFAAPYRDTIGDRPLQALHSFAHMPPMVDGAALALIGGPQLPLDSAPRAKIVAVSERCGSAAESLTGGFAAMEQALSRAGLGLNDLDCIEFMEAFAVVPALLEQRYQVDPDKVNIAGGHLAKGHPMGATGAVLLSCLMDALEHRDGRLGMVVATGASGIGAAMIIERLR